MIEKKVDVDEFVFAAKRPEMEDWVGTCRCCELDISQLEAATTSKFSAPVISHGPVSKSLDLD
jgi:hypothetical protein